MVHCDWDRDQLQTLNPKPLTLQSMDAANCSLAAGLVSQSYVSQGAAALGSRRRLVKALLSNRALPAEGWDEATIDMLLQVSDLCAFALACACAHVCVWLVHALACAHVCAWLVVCGRRGGEYCVA